MGIKNEANAGLVFSYDSNGRLKWMGTPRSGTTPAMEVQIKR